MVGDYKETTAVVYISIIERDISYQQGKVFSPEVCVSFSRTIPEVILHNVTQCDMAEFVCLTLLPAVQICL